MKPEYITHIKDNISFTFKLDHVTYMKHQHATMLQKELFVVVINGTMKTFMGEGNYRKLFELWTSIKPISHGKVLKLKVTGNTYDVS